MRYILVAWIGPFPDAEPLLSYVRDGELNIQALRQNITSLTREETHDFIATLVHRDRVSLWALLAQGHFVFWPILHEYHTIDPLVMAVNANQAEEDDDQEPPLPDTLLALLLARCNPNEFGTAAISPL